MINLVIIHFLKDEVKHLLHEHFSFVRLIADVRWEHSLFAMENVIDNKITFSYYADV